MLRMCVVYVHMFIVSVHVLWLCVWGVGIVCVHVFLHVCIYTCIICVTCVYQISHSNLPQVIQVNHNVFQED